jgi:hypothetical protein
MAAATATRSRRTCRCQSLPAGNVPSAKSWRSWPASVGKRPHSSSLLEGVRRGRYRHLVTPSKVIAATRAAVRRRWRPSRSGRAQQADGEGHIRDGALWRPAAGTYSQRRKPGQASTGRPSRNARTNCHPRQPRRPRRGEDGSPGGSDRRGCGRGGRCWVQPKQAGHVLSRHAAVVSMSQHGVAQGLWTRGSWQQCLSTIGSCRHRQGPWPDREPARRLREGVRHVHANGGTAAMAVLARCAAALTFSGWYVGGGQLQERAAAVGGGRRKMCEDVRWFPGAPAGLTPR